MDMRHTVYRGSYVRLVHFPSFQVIKLPASVSTLFVNQTEFAVIGV